MNTIAGTTGDDSLAGTVDVDLLLGDAGNDTLVGGGAMDLAGDTLVGGTGDDLYLIANPLDQLVENAGEGWDEVRTDLATYTLGDHVEALTHTGPAGFTGTGNALDNVITGGAGADTLDGGLGADTLVGGLGDDVYLVD
ncbi:calcium-binding protein, partial [Azospirillum oleiclasticum]|uniref:calcium-binding protein n=1 Tax=Azospirillum oleiclasticum TaxID=2735135 RepID=UPI0031F31A8F